MLRAQWYRKSPQSDFLGSPRTLGKSVLGKAPSPSPGFPSGGDGPPDVGLRLTMARPWARDTAILIPPRQEKIYSAPDGSRPVSRGYQGEGRPGRRTDVP